MNPLRSNPRFGDVKAIFFDFGGTLYETDDNVIDIWKKVLEDEGIIFDYPSYFNALRIARSVLDKHTAEKVFSSQAPEMPGSYWVFHHKIILKNMGITDKCLLEKFSLKITQLINNVEKRYKINKDVKESLTTLKEKYKIGLISNTATDFRPYLNKDGIINLFDVIGLSYEMGLWKPDERIFRECCRTIRIPPQNSAYVGDSPICDFKGALNAGMKSLLIGQHPNLSMLDESECVTIETVGDLLKIF